MLGELFPAENLPEGPTAPRFLALGHEIVQPVPEQDKEDDKEKEKEKENDTENEKDNDTQKQEYNEKEKDTEKDKDNYKEKEKAKNKIKGKSKLFVRAICWDMFRIFSYISKISICLVFNTAGTLQGFKLLSSALSWPPFAQSDPAFDEEEAAGRDARGNGTVAAASLAIIMCIYMCVYIYITLYSLPCDYDQLHTTRYI